MRLALLLAVLSFSFPTDSTPWDRSAWTSIRVRVVPKAPIRIPRDWTFTFVFELPYDETVGPRWEMRPTR